MENALAEAHEEIKHLEHVRPSRLKVVMTATILVITMVTTLAGVLAGMWSGRESEAQTARQQATAAALQAELIATTQQAAAAQSEDDVIEAGWRASFLYQESAQITDPQLKQTLLHQQDRADAMRKRLTGAAPPGAGSPGYFALLREPAMRAEQMAKADASEGVAWLAKSNGALAVISILALALFLVGLALTIANPRIQLGFTALSLVMLLVAGGRLGWIATSPVDAPTESCVDRYSEAATASATGHAAQARGELQAVTAACPTYSDAWATLATTDYDPSSAADRQRAENASRRALEVADAPSASLENNAGFDALLNHDLPAARRYLSAARQDGPDNPVVLASCAELAAAQGDTGAALHDFAEAAAQVADHGPYFRNDMFFAALRQDTGTFAAAGWHGPALDKLFLTGKQAEASLDSVGRSTPTSTHGAGISDVTLGPAQTIGGISGFLTIGFRYEGLRPGDHLAFRYYTNGDTTLQATASAPDILIKPGSALVGSGVFPAGTSRIDVGSVGPLTVEVYLNGVLQDEASYTT